MFDAFDLDSVRISGLNFNQSQHQLNKRISFQGLSFEINLVWFQMLSNYFIKVDVTKSGNGILTAQLMNLKNRESYHIDCFESVDTEVKGVYDVSFLPREPGYYKCMLLFNNKHIKGRFKIHLYK